MKGEEGHRAVIQGRFDPFDWPKIFFGFFLVVVCAAYLYFSPGWGFMDDLGNRQIAFHFWKGQLSFPALLAQEIQGLGRFHPIYYLWIIFAYGMDRPILVYLLVFLTGAGVLLLWGRLLNRLFPGAFSPSFNRFVLPLSFFLFLPFWNNFMYISIQEKFIFIFGTLSYFLLLKAYEKGSVRDLTFALVMAMAAIFGKETGVAFLAAYAGFALLDIALFRKNRKLSSILLVVTLVLGVGYFLFIKSILGGYTAHYKANLNLHIMLQSLWSTPPYIKVLMMVSILAGLLAVWDLLRGRKTCDPFFLVCPLWVIFFLSALLPWGFSTYLLAPLGPFVISCVLYFLVCLVKGRKMLAGLVQIAVLFGVMLVLAQVIIPRISKMADKRKVVEAVRTIEQHSPGRFFYPPPFEETAQSLEGFSSAKVIYTGRIDPGLLDAKGENYLVINDEAGPIMLEGVGIGKEVYRNGTWVVWTLTTRPGVRQEFRLSLPKNMLQKIKDLVVRY